MGSTSAATKLHPAHRIKVARDTECRRVLPTSYGIVVHGRVHIALLDPESFDQLWRVKVPEDSVPAFVRGSILAVGGPGGWFGLDLVDGGRIWGPSTLGSCTPWRERILAVQPVRLGYRPYQGLSEVNIATGEIVRVIAESEDVCGSPAISDDLIVGSNWPGDAITVFDLAAERVLWKRDLVSELRSRHNAATRIGGAAAAAFIAVQKDCLTPAGKKWRGGLFGCSLADGGVLWELEMSVKGNPTIVGNHVYMLEVDSSTPACFHCIDLQTGAIRYSVPQTLVHYLDHPYQGVAHDGNLIFSTSRGLLMALRMEDGAPRWWCQYRETLHPRPVSYGQRVLVPAFDGNLLVFDPPVPADAPAKAAPKLPKA